MELTEEQINFLAECEREFANRYTEKDESFMELKNKPLSKPPIVEPWGNNFNRNQQRGGRQGYRSYGQQHGRDHQRGGRNSWNQDGRDSYSRREYNDNRGERDRQYDDRNHNRNRPYDDRGYNRDRQYDNRGPHRGASRDRAYDDRNQHRGDSHHHPRYHPY